METTTTNTTPEQQKAKLLAELAALTTELTAMEAQHKKLREKFNALYADYEGLIKSTHP